MMALNPVTSASGEIWDIDGHNNNTEQFFVEAFNGTESLAEILSPLGQGSQVEAYGTSFLFDIR